MANLIFIDNFLFTPKCVVFFWEFYIVLMNVLEES